MPPLRTGNVCLVAETISWTCQGHQVLKLRIAGVRQNETVLAGYVRNIGSFYSQLVVESRGLGHLR